MFLLAKSQLQLSNPRTPNGQPMAITEGHFFICPWPSGSAGGRCYDVCIGGREGLQTQLPPYLEFIMSKGPVIKFPKVEAGFYSITRDGVIVGYIKKEVDGKETNWWVYDTVDMENLSSETAIDTANELFREAKVDATAYFLDKKVEVAEVADVIEAPAPVIEQPVVDEDDFFDTASVFEDVMGEFEDAVFEYEDEPALVWLSPLNTLEVIQGVFTLLIIKIYDW